MASCLMLPWHEPGTRKPKNSDRRRRLGGSNCSQASGNNRHRIPNTPSPTEFGRGTHFAARTSRAADHSKGQSYGHLHRDCQKSLRVPVVLLVSYIPGYLLASCFGSKRKAGGTNPKAGQLRRKKAAGQRYRRNG